jgi:hypothetical protein
MRAKLLALSVGIAMLSGAGTACADAVVSAGTQTKAAVAGLKPVGTQMPVAGQRRRPLVLTEKQMGKITAGLGGNGHGIGLLGGNGRGLDLLGGPGNPADR